MVEESRYMELLHQHLGETKVPHKMRMTIQQRVTGANWFGKKFRKKKQMDILKRFKVDVLDPIGDLILTPEARDAAVDAVLKSFMRGWGVEMVEPVKSVRVDKEALAGPVRRILVSHKGSITEKIDEIVCMLDAHVQEQQGG